MDFIENTTPTQVCSYSTCSTPARLIWNPQLARAVKPEPVEQAIPLTPSRSQKIASGSTTAANVKLEAPIIPSSVSSSYRAFLADLSPYNCNSLWETMRSLVPYTTFVPQSKQQTNTTSTPVLKILYMFRSRRCKRGWAWWKKSGNVSAALRLGAGSARMSG